VITVTGNERLRSGGYGVGFEGESGLAEETGDEGGLALDAAEHVPRAGQHHDERPHDPELPVTGSSQRPSCP